MSNTLPNTVEDENSQSFRYRFVEQMAAARARLKLELPEGNTDHLKGHPGFMPWSINEHYLKLVNSFLSASLQVHGHPGESQRPSQCGVSHEHSHHFVGDAAQHLHTTVFNGWTGENPKYAATADSSWVGGGFFKATTDPDEATITKKLNPAALLCDRLHAVGQRTIPSSNRLRPRTTSIS